QGATGALILEIPREDRKAQADLLAEKLREVLADRAKINRSQKMREIRIRGMEISTTEREVVEHVVEYGGCEPADVQTGKIRTTPNGSRSLWLRCPLTAAKKVAERETLAIGWTQARAELLDFRLLQCYRCLERGHVQQNCKSGTDRSRNCYRCGESGHQ
ncbi:hypothetical protein EAI_08639, partial [Harpegnathos saltator]